MFVWYFAAVNILTFYIYGLDKYRAVKRKWRIPERTLLGLAAVGGAVGALAGMLVFRHKIRKSRFVICVPLLAILYIVVCYLLMR